VSAEVAKFREDTYGLLNWLWMWTHDWLRVMDGNDKDKIVYVSKKVESN